MPCTLPAWPLVSSVTSTRNATTLDCVLMAFAFADDVALCAADMARRIVRTAESLAFLEVVRTHTIERRSGESIRRASCDTPLPT